jgi:putative ABC transport system permease protein
MLLDMRVALRALRNNREFAAVGVITLALGTGANTAMFSVVDSVLLRPLPGFQTERLVNLYEASPRSSFRVARPLSYREWRKQAKSFEGLAANQSCSVTLTGLGEPEQLMGAPCVTANWFDVYHVAPLLGRTFIGGEDQPGRKRVVVLDYYFWMSRFSGDPKAIGKSIALDKQTYQIVGVMPPDFQPLGRGRSLYLPYVLDDITQVFVTGRLKRSAFIETARAELAVIERGLAAAHPGDYAGLQVVVQPLLEQQTGSQRPLLLLLLGAVSLVLLIACVNVASLFLARGSGRSHEIAIRAALGASRWDLIRPMLIESALVAFAGTALGVAAAFWTVRILALRMPGLPRADEIGINPTVLTYACALSVFCALLSGLTPAFSTTRVTARATGNRLRSGLVISEVALAFVLLIGAGLLIRSLAAMTAVDLGYRPKDVLTMFLALPEDARENRPDAVALYRRIRERLQGIHGVRSVTVASAFPSGGVAISLPVYLEGEDIDKDKAGEKSAQVVIAGPDHFRALGIPMLAGRAFNDRDNEGSNPVIIVSKSVADRYFPGRSPIGQRIQMPKFAFNLRSFGNVTLREIVGVVGNVRHASFADAGAMDLYLPEGQNAIRLTFIGLRTDGDPLSYANAAKRAIFAERPDLPVTQVRPLEQLIAFMTEGPRQGMWMLSVFSMLALILAAVGIFGVISYAASRRTREIGVRFAIGARPRDVLGMIAGQALRLSLAGVFLGALLALGFTRLLRGLLFGVTATDGLTFAVGAAILVAIAIVASLVPARAASRIHPSAALRHE